VRAATAADVALENVAVTRSAPKDIAALRGGASPPAWHAFLVRVVGCRFAKRSCIAAMGWLHTLSTATWPIGPVIEVAVARPDLVKPAQPVAKPYADSVSDHIAVLLSVRGAGTGRWPACR
jgi:hypothetical protein